MRIGRWCVAMLLYVGTYINAGAETGLVAFWELAENARDYSGHARHAENHGVIFDTSAPDGRPAARFDGRAAHLEVPPSLAPRLGTGDFTLSLWICTESVLDDALGDLMSQYNPETRRGFNFGLTHCSGVANSQPNYRNLHFGIDNARQDLSWTDCGRPGKAILIFGFAVHEGNLYAATCEAGANESGHVYRYESDGVWTDCGSPDASNAVAALAVHNGELYAGTSFYDTTGSALSPSPNTTPGGRVYRYAGGSEWVFCGGLENPETGVAATMGGLAVFRGSLYATTLKQDGLGLYRYEGGTQWTYCGHPGRRVLNPCAFNGHLYMVSYDMPGGPFRYDGADWAYVGATIDPPIHQDYSFAVYGGRLHVSTWPQAYVYRMEPDGRWTPCGKPGDELETMAMMTYNGKLYVGTLPSSRVYRYDGGDVWTPFGQQLDTAEGKYRRAWSMAVYQGKLFCGTLPSGRVFKIEAGRNVTHDHALQPGWRHLAAVRDGVRLRLYVDGKPIGESAAFDPSGFDLTNDQPLRIGFGAGDYFNGWMRNLRIYDRVLSGDEIHKLCADELR